MKKLLVTILIIIIGLFGIGCEEVEIKNEGTSNESMFVIVETTYSWKVVYHKKTKVMYAVSYGSKNCGTFTLLVDENGKPMLWEKE